MAELKYEITAQIGVLSERSGWTKELNMIRWNDREPKYDIRDWSPDKAKMSKGITMTLEEVIALRDLLNGLNLEAVADRAGRRLPCRRMSAKRRGAPTLQKTQRPG